jgi:hypothetical protein
VTFGTTTRQNGDHATFVGLAPSADIFLTDRLTIGARVQTSRYTSRTTTEATPAGSRAEGYAATAEPRVGYVVPLTDDVLLWPQASLSAGGARSSGGATRTLDYELGTSIEVGLVFPLGRHVLASIAPVLSYAHDWSRGAPSGDGDAVSAGFRTHIGAVF